MTVFFRDLPRRVPLPGNRDFLLTGGRIQIGDTDGQTIGNILKANRGEFKKAPLIGGEVAKIRNGQPNTLWCVRV